jgi:hypothetical protein
VWVGKFVITRLQKRIRVFAVISAIGIAIRDFGLMYDEDWNLQDQKQVSGSACNWCFERRLVSTAVWRSTIVRNLCQEQNQVLGSAWNWNFWKNNSRHSLIVRLWVRKLVGFCLCSSDGSSIIGLTLSLAVVDRRNLFVYSSLTSPRSSYKQVGLHHVSLSS